MIFITMIIILGAFPFFVYSVYLSAVLFGKPIGDVPLSDKDVRRISVVIPTYNESEVIEHRINNLANLNYPKDMIEVIVVDDDSTDDTVTIARSAFKKYGLDGKVIVKDVRSGTNVSVNIGVLAAKNAVAVTTDADVVFDREALRHALGVLLSDDSVGAVCGELEPIVTRSSFTTHSEQAYRSVYGKMCTWESKLHSTYCFNGPLIVLKKEAFSPIPETHGASDAGMALKIIRNGYRCVYVASAKFNEYIPENIGQQKRQKLRRSARLLEATAYNIDMVAPKYGKFGLVVFPLRILMFLIVPAAFFTSVGLAVYVLSMLNMVYGILAVVLFILVLLMGRIYSNLVSSFIWHQMYLFVSLFYMFRGVHIWKAVDREKV